MIRLGMFSKTAQEIVPVWINRAEILRAQEEELFTAAVHSGQQVVDNNLIGDLNDFSGKLILEVRAPFDL